MSLSKPWDWKQEKDPIWLNPSEDSYSISARWKAKGFIDLLDFGCGLGRHSVFFSQQGFRVSAFDLSSNGIEYLRAWAQREELKINMQIADMVSLPYQNNSFDCLFAYHVISHTNTAGMGKIMNEIKRIVKPGGEIYMTLCSKETWSFVEAGYPKIDENTVLKTADGPEKDIPHYYVDLDDIVKLFSDSNMELLRIRHIDDCYFEGQRRNSKHYFILASNG